MAFLTAWYNLVFLLPLVAGILMVFGSLLGITGDADHDVEGDAGHDMDGDHDMDHDAEGSHDNGRWFPDIMTTLGFGRVPISIVLMMMLLLFGGIGMMCNYALAPLLRTGHLYGLISVGVACIGMFFLTSRFAGLINKHMPTSETYVITKQGLIGKMGTLTLPVSAERIGTANVRDESATVHPITCVSNGGELRSGEGIVVVDYDDEQRHYVVARFDV